MLKVYVIVVNFLSVFLKVERKVLVEWSIGYNIYEVLISFFNLVIVWLRIYFKKVFLLKKMGIDIYV